MRPIEGSSEFRIMKSLLLALMLAPAAAQAATTPPPVPTTAAPAKPVPRAFPGLSPAGNATLAKLQSTPDPQLNQIVQQQRRVHDELMTVVTAATIDPAKVADIMHRADDLQGQLRARATERLVQAVTALPEADRGPFLRALVIRPSAPASATPVKP
jgi:uncharacterized membrane protein